MIQIWGRNNSHNVQKVLWFCGEIGLEFKREDAGLEFGRVRDADMLARNPNAVIPTIEDDGFVIWESNVILRHLARKYGGADFYPESVEMRTEVERWMDWQQTTLLSPMTTIFWGRARAPDKFPKSEIDEAVQKATYPAVVGLAKSQKIAAELPAQAFAALKPFKGQAVELEALADYLLKRDH